MDNSNEPKIHVDVRTHEVNFPDQTNVRHKWTQRGHTIHCEGLQCQPHGHHVGPDQILMPDATGEATLHAIKIHQPKNVKGPDLEKLAKAQAL